MRDLDGRIAAVTGAARGIGRATAAELVRQGMWVAIGDLDGAAARRAAREIGPGAVGLPVDVTERTSFEAFVDTAERELGELDVLVNNAGITYVGAFAGEDQSAAERMVAVNVGGVLNGMKTVLPRMTGRGRGHVVNIASCAGKVGYPDGATYSGTKFFVV